jgi:DNA-binding GntR family transcriptional regulator
MLPWLADSASDSGSHKRDIPLAKLVRDEMLSLILRGELVPGQRINEPDLAARMSVSRVPVREALRELESSGLIASRKHSGVFVRTLQPKEVAELYELRSVLDGHAGGRVARLPAAQRRRLVKRLEGLMRDMERQSLRNDVQSYYASNLRFHWILIEAADNALILETYRNIVQQLHLSRLKNLSHNPGMQVSMQEHEQIVAALADGDAEHCTRLMATHVSASHTRLREWLDESLG